MRETLRGATVAQTRRALTERFRAAGIESPELDARVLIGHALGLDHAGLASGAAQPVADAAIAQIEQFATRRLAGEPVARIVGEKEFWGLVACRDAGRAGAAPGHRNGGRACAGNA